MRSRSYYDLLTRWTNRDVQFAEPRLSLDYAPDLIDHPDFDVPGVMVSSPTGRVLLIVEGEKEFVGPVVEAARAQFDALGA